VAGATGSQQVGPAAGAEKEGTGSQQVGPVGPGSEARGTGRPAGLVATEHQTESSRRGIAMGQHGTCDVAVVTVHALEL
jgi:hypothetical protein